MQKKQALIVWGGWEGHTPEQSANVTKTILEKHDFGVTVESSTKAYADLDLTKFDLIVPMITMSTIEPEELKCLVAAVRAGTGLAGFHGTMGDSFRNEVDYQFMVGGQWVQHPGDFMTYQVNITKSDDPIVAGIEDFEYHSEQYYMHVDPSNEVLATTTFNGDIMSEIEGVVMPVAWKRKHGEGRVFYSGLGHNADEFEHDAMRTIFERGALWAAR